MTTRFLLTVISSFYFDGDRTLDDLHEEIATDAAKLYSSGINVVAWFRLGSPLFPELKNTSIFYRLMGASFHA